MALKDDISAALEPLVDEYVEWGGAACLDQMTSAVWSVLEDKVGSVQEQLMTQLTMARSELQACRDREAALALFAQEQAAALERLAPTEA